MARRRRSNHVGHTHITTVATQAGKERLIPRMSQLKGNSDVCVPCLVR